jgi:flagellar hook-associated protein 2
LKLEITLTESQLGMGEEGTISITRGFASMMEETLDYITKTGDGVIARKTGGLQGQIDNITRQIKEFDERLALRRESLVKKWAELEMILGELQTEQQFLTAQLENITANFAQIMGSE